MQRMGGSGHGLTEAVEGGTDEHEDVAFGATQCWPVFIGQLIGGNQHS